jgi:predicted phosphodiesterase
MKIAVLSDIHANFAALQAVAEDIAAWAPDQVVMAGDLVNRGPRPAECLRFVQEQQRSREPRGWLSVVGNHEQFVIRHAHEHADPGEPQFEIRRSSYWTYQQLGRDVAALEAMPYALDLTTPDRHASRVRIAHASMRGTRDGVYEATTDDELRDQIGTPAPAVFCVGHTHMPLVRQVNGTLVVNAGSAGLPFDHDPRASYARLTWHAHHQQWQAEIRRLVYDRAQAERDFVDSGFLEQGGPLARLILVELRESRSQLYQWTCLYEQLVLSGKLTAEESVDEFLGSGQ